MTNRRFPGNGKDRRKALRLIGRAGLSSQKENISEGTIPIEERRNWGLIITYWSGLVTFLGFGYALAFDDHSKLAAALYAVSIFQLSLGFWLWSKWKRGIRAIPPIIFIGVCFFFGYRWLINPFQEPEYLRPKGPGIRVDIKAPVASGLLCQGLSQHDENQCLCPRPLPYELKALAQPSNDNYATEVTITAKREPIYRLRIFGRTQMRSGRISASPYGDGEAAVGVLEMDYDPFSLVMNSSAPQQELKVEVHTSEGLRIKCINQEN
jgi:hypothetical protein